MMRKNIARHQWVVWVLIFLGVSVMRFEYFSIMLLTALLVLHFFYSVFYVELPKVYYLFMIAGISIAVVNWFRPLPAAIDVFIVICFLEAVRIVVMAVLKYPSTIQDLQTLTDDLEERVKQRTLQLEQANKQLQFANERLKELDQMKTAFVSQASHDLRTPLTAIKGSLDNLSLGIAGELNEKQQKIVGRAIRSVDRLTNLINDVLDLSRIESGRIVLDKKDLDFNTLVAQAIQENRPAADQRNLSLMVNESTETLMIYADAGKLQRVVGELISNAIKYTHEKGHITVSLYRQDNQAVLTVEDNGIGMTEKDRLHIWDRFYRSASSKHFAKGSGLGLSIAKELIELHNGTISVASEEGKGTTFTFKLPLVSHS